MTTRILGAAIAAAVGLLAFLAIGRAVGEILAALPI